MDYKLYKNNTMNDTSNVLKTVLQNRNINDYKRYCNLDSSVEIHYSKLDNIEEAVECFDSHFQNKNTIGILFDEDVDGATSGSLMYRYILDMDEKHPVKYIFHNEAKMHGLSDDVIIPNDIKLLIIPDASTNDTEQCKKLKEQGIDIIILDHHEREKDNPYAIIVNNQISKDYENKALAGVGVVYKFLQALDNFYWFDYADNYLDLVALGLISDSMDVRSFETKYLIDKGLKNINNKFFEAMIKVQDYSMKGVVSINSVQWYVTPIINAMIRIGDKEEKELLFRAIMGIEETFEYAKKGKKGEPSEVIQENIFDRACRLCKNAKARQDKLKEKGVEALSSKIMNECKDDKVILVDGTNDINKALSGVIAIKLADLFNKPCLVLYQKESNGNMVYKGSGRNIDNSSLESLKDIINVSEVFTLAQGHPNAFGIELDLNSLTKAREKLNDILKDVSFDFYYLVDMVVSSDEVDVELVSDFNKLRNYVGQGFKEPLIKVDDIRVEKSQCDICGKKSDTISFTYNDIKYLMFGCEENNKVLNWINDGWSEGGILSMNIIGKPSLNEFNGTKTPQIEIVDYEITSISESDSQDLEDVWED